jgi:hypothetical protein
MHVGRCQPCFAERRKQQIMAARSFGHRDALALQIRKRMQRSVALHDDGLGAGRRRFLRDIHKTCMRGLGEHRDRIGNIGAKVDRVGVECFG